VEEESDLAQAWVQVSGKLAVAAVALDSRVTLWAGSISLVMEEWILHHSRTIDQFPSCLLAEPTLMGQDWTVGFGADWRVLRMIVLVSHLNPCQASGIWVLTRAFSLLLRIVADSS